VRAPALLSAHSGVSANLKQQFAQRRAGLDRQQCQLTTSGQAEDWIADLGETAAGGTISHDDFSA